MFYFISVFVTLLGVSMCQDYKASYLDLDEDEGLNFLNDYGLWKPIDIIGENGGCCVPPVMEMDEGMMLGEAGPGRGKRGQPKMILANIHVALNSKKNMTYANIFLNINGRGMHLQAWQDFNARVQYTLDVPSGKCKKSPAQYNPYCIPAGTKVLGSVTFGTQTGANHINGTWYQLEKAGNVGFVSMTSTGKKNECIPVTESFYGRTKGVSYTGTVDFFNFAPRVKDPKVFIIPSQCKKDGVLIEREMAQSPFGESMFFN